MEEIMNRPQTPPSIPKITPLSREIVIQDFPNVFIEVPYWKEMEKPPIPSHTSIVTPLPKPHEVTRMNNDHYLDDNVPKLHPNGVICDETRECESCFMEAMKEAREWKRNEKKRKEEEEDAVLYTYVPW